MKPLKQKQAMGNPSSDTLSPAQRFHKGLVTALSFELADKPHCFLEFVKKDPDTFANGFARGAVQSFIDRQAISLSPIVAAGAMHAGITKPAAEIGIEDIYKFLETEPPTPEMLSES